jgi:hypothetical protein
MRPALDHAPHHPALLQHPQVPGDRGLGHTEAGGGLTDGRGALGEPFDDAAADRVRERPERIVNHLVNRSKADGWLWHRFEIITPSAAQPASAAAGARHTRLTPEPR